MTSTCYTSTSAYMYEDYHAHSHFSKIIGVYQ